MIDAIIAHSLVALWVMETSATAAALLDVVREGEIGFALADWLTAPRTSEVTFGDSLAHFI